MVIALAAIREKCVIATYLRPFGSWYYLVVTGLMAIGLWPLLAFSCKEFLHECRNDDDRTLAAAASLVLWSLSLPAPGRGVKLVNSGESPS